MNTSLESLHVTIEKQQSNELSCNAKCSEQACNQCILCSRYVWLNQLTSRCTINTWYGVITTYSLLFFFAHTNTKFLRVFTSGFGQHKKLQLSSKIFWSDSDKLLLSQLDTLFHAIATKSQLFSFEISFTEAVPWRRFVKMRNVKIFNSLYLH